MTSPTVQPSNGAQVPLPASSVAPSMYQLTAVRLINWYHFPDVTFTMDGSTLLLGDNGSGKSTVLDAIQLALVADLSEVRFNKAANERSSRTAYTYVRGKLGAESTTDVRYTRGSCTGHVLLEFTRASAARAGLADARFVVGLVMDVIESDSEVKKGYVVVPNVTVADIPAVVEVPGGLQVRSTKEYRTAIRAMGGEYLTDTASYRGKLRQRLGPVPESFHRQIAKGLEFKPMGHIRDFVMNYLAEPVTIQTGPLLTNLDNYKSMEQEAAAAATRIERLEDICEKGQRVQETARQLRSHEFMTLRANVEVCESAQETLEVEIDQTARSLIAQSQLVDQLDARLRVLEQQRANLQEDLAKQDVVQAKRRAEEDLARTREDIRRAKEATTKAREILDVQTQALDRLLSEDARAVRAAWADERDGAGLFPPSALFGSTEAPDRLAQLRAVLVAEGSLAGRDLRTWSGRLRTAREQVQEAGFHLNQVHSELRKEDAELRDELALIDAGRVQYPPATDALLFLLKQKLASPKRAPQPICELIEVANERWRDSVEAVLGNRRFDVLVAAEDYQRVSSLYEQHRRGVELPRRGTVELGGVGVIDIERVAGHRSRAEPGSLAEQVTTDDPLVQAYINFALGNVICVEDVRDLRKHRTAVTPTVMIYQGFTVRHPSQRSYRPGVIGVAARVKRRSEIDIELAQIAESLGGLEHDQIVLQRTAALCDKAIAQVERFPDVVADAAGLAGLLHLEGEQVQRVDTFALRVSADVLAAKLAARLDTVQLQIGDANDERKAASEAAGGLRERQRNLLERSEKTFNDVLRATAAFESAFPPNTPKMHAALEEAYAAERAKPRAAVSIFEAFERMLKNFATRMGNDTDALVAAKASFNAQYGAVGLATGTTYDEYRRERNEWVDSRLPEFRERMEQARLQATEQLAEHVVSQLGESFARLERNFNELNRALREVTFGADRYQFVYSPDPSLRTFYDLIKEASKFTLGRGSLFADQALPPLLRETLDGMVERLLQHGPTAVKTDLERLTDYREYYRYDIRIDKADGSRSSYEAVAGDNSGGETQTPYYIAILASMLQMYRTLHADRKPRCGLVLLDEAFSKMDGGRIAATLAFVRELGLQIVMACPKEKVDVVARHVSTSIFIDKDPITGVPSVYDFGRAMTEIEDGDESSARDSLVGESEFDGASEGRLDSRVA